MTRKYFRNPQECEVQSAQAVQEQNKHNRTSDQATMEQSREVVALNTQTCLRHHFECGPHEMPTASTQRAGATVRWKERCVAKITQLLDKSDEYETQGMDPITAHIVAMMMASESLLFEAQLLRHRFTPPALSPQAHKALILYNAGYSIPEIAQQWSVSTETVKTHLRRACSSLGVTHRKDALIVARTLDLV